MAALLPSDGGDGDGDGNGDGDGDGDGLGLGLLPVVDGVSPTVQPLSAGSDPSGKILMSATKTCETKKTGGEESIERIKEKG